MSEEWKHAPPRGNADLIPVRMCNELVYCPRLFHLEFVQGVFIESADTVEGAAQHARAEKRGTRSRVAGARGNGAGRAEDDRARGGGDGEGPEVAAEDLWDGLPPRPMAIQSEAWGVTGKFDFVEVADGEVIVLEAKHGSAPRGDGPLAWGGHELDYGAWPADVAQVGLYMALVREMGLPCSEARIFYRKSGSRVSVPWSERLELFLRDVVAEARAVAAREQPPAPLVDSPKCVGCSLHAACLPDEHAALAALERGEPPPEVRRIVAGRDDRAVVHVVSPGATVRKSGDSLVVTCRGGEPTKVPLVDVQHVALFGRTHITEPCVQHLLREGIAISHHTGAGRMLGITAPVATTNVGMRRAQFRAADDEEKRREIARAFVVAKIRNQRTVLRRHRSHALTDPGDLPADLPEWAGDEGTEAGESAGGGAGGACERVGPPAVEGASDGPLPKERAPSGAGGDSSGAEAGDRVEREGPSGAEVVAEAIRRMGVALDAARRAATVDAIRGHEGDAAAAYFGALAHVLPPAFRGDFCGRTRRPPRDRVNAMLSFGYALLLRDATAACVRIGLDPMLGYLHTMLPGRPALALDVMEPFRAAWVDTAMLRLMATGGIRREDFHVTLAGVMLSDKGRRAVIGAYERRADELITHPRFGYRMSYRRILELEVRVLGKYLMGEVRRLAPLWTR